MRQLANVDAVEDAVHRPGHRRFRHGNDDQRISTPSTGATRTVAAATRRTAQERLAAVQAIAKPQTDDSGDDEYSYGFRLWDAGFFPEAQQQLTMFVEQNPGHWRATYGRNLLGRAYLDDGKAKEAAPWFLKNYQEDKTGARAGDSLLYLAESMIALDDTRRACIALARCRNLPRACRGTAGASTKPIAAR